MAEIRVRMRVLVAGSTDAGDHRPGDLITVDEPHAAVFATIGFAERLEAIHVTAVTTSPHTVVIGSIERSAGRRSR